MARSHGDPHDGRDACLDTITTCDRLYGWNLDEARRQHYVAAIAPLVSTARPTTRLHDIVVNYHTDHARVDALRNAAQHDHDAAWQSHMAHIVAVLRSKGLSWSSDKAIDSDDIVQFVYGELVRALPNYRYESRFSTWMYAVVIQSAGRMLRHTQAAKRAERPASLAVVPEVSQPVDDASMEAEANAKLLQELVASVLSGQPDARLATIFQLWAIHDQHIDQIGRIVQLHPSRVRALLAQALAVLRQHPSFRAWRHPDGEPDGNKQETA